MTKWSDMTSGRRVSLMREAVRTLLLAVGENPKREGLRDTPDRVMRSLWEMTEGYSHDPKHILSTRFSARTYDEMVVVRDIGFWSTCEHHLLPIYGTATVGYVPNGRVVGLSKVARLVHCFALRLQIQERMTEEIASAMQRYLKPRGVGVVISARHLCMEMRGVKTPGDMVTSKLLGVMRTRPATRAEFLKLAKQR